MPKAKGDRAVNLARLEQDMAAHPEDYFSAEETERRMGEVMARIGGRPRGMNLRTGQNVSEPLLSDEELRDRGYPCEEGFGD